MVYKLIRCFNGLCAVFACLSNPLFSQQLNFQTFSFREGLSTYNISNTVQDRHGFIWIATQDGIYRYNGRSFQVFKNNSGKDPSTLGNVFLNVTYDNKDAMYCADYMNGFDIINTTNLNITKAGSDTLNSLAVPDYWIWDILFDNNRNTWLRGINYFAWKKENEKKFTVVRLVEGFNGTITPSFIRLIGPQHIAIGIPGFGTLIYDSRTLEKKGVIRNFGPASTATGDIRDIALKGDTAYLATQNSIIAGTYRDHKWVFSREYNVPAFASTVVNSIVRDRNNSVWAGTNNGLFKIDLESGKAIQFQVMPGKTRWLADNTIRHLMLDRQDNLWISTSSVLQMVNTSGNGFTAFDGTGTGSDPIDHIYTLSEKNKDEIFATGTNGLFEVNILTGLSKKIPGTETLGYVHHIEKINPDQWLLSTDMGMYIYQPSTKQLSQESLLRKYPEWGPYIKNYFNTAYRVNHTWYWASEEMEGLIKWNMDTHNIQQYKAGTETSHGLPENHLRNLKPDQEGYLWILSDESVSRFDLQKDSVTLILHHDKKNLNSSIVFDMYDDSHTLWFATYGGGINGYHKKTRRWTYITEAEGLTNNAVYGILPESDSIIWATTNIGLSRINTRTLKCSGYYYEDGLQDNCFDEKGVLRSGNKLFFGGIKGFTCLNLSAFQPREYAFPVFIHMIEYYKGSKKFVLNNLEWGKIILPPGAGPVDLHLSALSFTGNNSVSFSYRIPGIINEYITVPENNIISLTGLSYGHYNIYIRFRKKDGTFDGKELTASIFIRPRWYQTWAFRSLVLLLLIAAVYGLFRIRINQLRKEEKIRNQLASDLHDDLGSTLNSIKVHSNLAQMEKDNSNHLVMVKQGAQDAINGVRDIIWVLDDNKDQLTDTFARVAQFAEPLCQVSRINYKSILEDETQSYKLGKEEKRNLYMIIKESINNSLKYADCSQIILHASRSDKKLRIEISDNGKGFDLAATGNGYGLRNIRNRAKTVGYAAEIISSPGTGTRILLQKM